MKNLSFLLNTGVAAEQVLSLIDDVMFPDNLAVAPGIYDNSELSANCGTHLPVARFLGCQVVLV